MCFVPWRCSSCGTTCCLRTHRQALSLQTAIRLSSVTPAHLAAPLLVFRLVHKHAVAAVCRWPVDAPHRVDPKRQGAGKHDVERRQQRRQPAMHSNTTAIQTTAQQVQLQNTMSSAASSADSLRCNATCGSPAQAVQRAINTREPAAETACTRDGSQCTQVSTHK